MRNNQLLILTVSVLFTALQSWAGLVDATTAATRAQQFVNSRARAGLLAAPAPGSLQLVRTVTSSTNRAVPVYYIFNVGDQGFVIASGEDRAMAILAYGDRPLDVDNMPQAMQYWLDCYRQQLEFLQQHPDVVVTASPSRVGQTVDPMISANWSQNAPYWNECPVFGADTCLTGCPATSLSMVFHYWKYPRQQTPAVPSYTIPTYGVLLPELPPTTFDWAGMLDNYTAGSYTAAQASAVAHLMRYIGQAEQMDYTISGSGAYGKDVLTAVKFFEYDQGAQLLYKTDDLGYANYSDAQWAALLQDELAAGRPVVYCAYDNYTGSGHAFNVDGYDAASDTYHINWGWNGRGNGHFALNAFSYGDYTFGTGQQMVIGIQPPEGYDNPRLQAYPGTLAMQAYPGNPVTATISLKGTNLEGDVTLTLNDADGVFALDAPAVSQETAEAGHDITVTYAPTAVGSTTASIVCSSPGADDLTIILNGTAPLEIYQPEMLPVDDSKVTLTSFTADWIDATPTANVASYTLEVFAKPDYMLLEEADFSDLPKMTPTNQASHATDYLPQGWSFTGSEFNLEGGCIMPRRNGVITTDALSLKGYDKVTVVVTGRSYGSWGDPSELTVSTSLASQTIEFPFYYAPVAVVLDCAEGDAVSFKAGYYPMIQNIKIYAGDASGAALRAQETGDEGYRLITGITARSYTVRDLSAGGTFFYQVKAVYTDGTESQWSDSREVTLHESQQQHLAGDVDHNGEVSISDVTLLIDYLLGVESNVCLQCADVDGDGEASIGDASAIIDLLLGNG